MKTIFSSVVVGVFLPLSAVSARDINHWLIGRWTGQIENYTGKQANRMFRVQDLSSEGTAVGLWGIPPERRGLADFKVDGAQVQIFVRSSKTNIDLSRPRYDELIGKFVWADGRRFSN